MLRIDSRHHSDNFEAHQPASLQYKSYEQRSQQPQQQLEQSSEKQTMASSSKAGRIASLGLRLFVFLFCMSAVIIIATDVVTVPDLTGDTGEETKIGFKDVLAYRYLFSVAVIGSFYSLIQIPFAALSISRGKNLISKQLVPLYIFTDVVMSLLLATGVGAGFGITVDLKRVIDKVARQSGLEDIQLAKDIDKALDLVHGATGFVLAATFFMTFVLLISIVELAKK